MYTNIKKYFKVLNEKMKQYDKKAKNPFLEYNYAHNPFKSAVYETKVWVETPSQDENQTP